MAKASKSVTLSEEQRKSKHTRIALSPGERINPTLPVRYREILDMLCEVRGVNASELVRALLLEESKRVEKSTQGRR